MLDLTALEKALTSLKTGLTECQQTPHNLLLRDGAIQRFEYTYEIAIKMLRRQLEYMVEAASLIDQMSYRDLLRTGAEKGFIDDPTAWFNFRDKRNITSHTYDEKKAATIYAVLPEFVNQADFLLQQLRQHNRE